MSEYWREDVSLLDAYLDDLLSASETELFLGESVNRQELIGQRELQSKIDDSIRQSFRFDPLSEEQINQITAKVECRVDTSLVSHDRRRRWLLATAAVLFLSACCGIWNIAVNWREDAPVFEQRPLVAIYLETTERGFKPYYECHDDQRFADVFENRQNRALRLADMPADRQMLGISYLGGVSRNTTAVLCEADGKPIIVFVDKLKRDQPDIALSNSSPTLQVTRVVKDNLVFYEVSPFKSPRMIEYFEFLE